MALPLSQRVVAPVLRTALSRLQGDATSGAAEQRRALEAVLAAVPDGATSLPLEALFSTAHGGLGRLLKRYRQLPQTGYFTGKRGGVRFAFPFTRVFRLPPVTSSGDPWSNLAPASSPLTYRTFTGDDNDRWGTLEDWQLGRNGRYQLGTVPREDPGVPVVALDAGINCPLFCNTGRYVFSGHWYRGRTWRAGRRTKWDDVKAAEAAMAETVSRAVGELEFLEYLETRAQVGVLGSAREWEVGVCGVGGGGGEVPKVGGVLCCHREVVGGVGALSACAGMRGAPRRQCAAPP